MISVLQGVCKSNGDVGVSIYSVCPLNFTQFHLGTNRSGDLAVGPETARYQSFFRQATAYEVLFLEFV